MFYREDFKISMNSRYQDERKERIFYRKNGFAQGFYGVCINCRLAGWLAGEGGTGQKVAS